MQYTYKQYILKWEKYKQFRGRNNFCCFFFLQLYFSFFPVVFRRTFRMVYISQEIHSYYYASLTVLTMHFRLSCKFSFSSINTILFFIVLFESSIAHSLTSPAAVSRHYHIVVCCKLSVGKRNVNFGPIIIMYCIFA